MKFVFPICLEGYILSFLSHEIVFKYEREMNLGYLIIMEHNGHFDNISPNKPPTFNWVQRPDCIPVGSTIGLSIPIEAEFEMSLFIQIFVKNLGAKFQSHGKVIYIACVITTDNIGGYDINESFDNMEEIAG